MDCTVPIQPVGNHTGTKLGRSLTIYLIPECDTKDEVREVLEELCEEIFVEQLDSWFRDMTTWPTDRSYEAFCRWFDVQFTQRWPKPHQQICRTWMHEGVVYVTIEFLVGSGGGDIRPSACFWSFSDCRVLVRDLLPVLRSGIPRRTRSYLIGPHDSQLYGRVHPFRNPSCQAKAITRCLIRD